MTATIEERKAANKALIDEVLKAYPEKMAKRRAKPVSYTHLTLPTIRPV